MKDAKNLRWNLKSLGFSGAAIDAAWPEWWSDAAEASTSAQIELRFSLSRKLGLDPKSLLDDEPRFVWSDEAKFKRLTVESEFERSALASFGTSVGRSLLAATPEAAISVVGAPEVYRATILKQRPFVGLGDLLALCWGLGIPVIHLRVFPLTAKRMAAMVVQVNGRFAILLGRDASFPAPLAYYLAHELGHAALGHLANNVAVVEFGDSLTGHVEADEEEKAADRFALELLTGMPSPRFLANGSDFNAPSIAASVLGSAEELGIEPGVMALCFGYSTGAWQQVFSALSMIYRESRAVWRDVNAIAVKQLDWSALNDDTANYLSAIMGGEYVDKRRTRQ